MRHAASFRDPGGFVFWHGDVLYRQINNCYRKHYQNLMQSGLYAALVGEKLLLPHAEVTDPPAQTADAHAIIRPEPIAFISYPYEWSFSQLKEAALLTLAIQKVAMRHGMSLKDCSAYNVQFRQGRPVFIDTLSFEPYRDGQAWVAYRQFCQHFLAPLALMSHTDIRLQQLARTHLDGVPLDLASRLLPARTWFQLPLLVHLHVHAKSQKHYAGKKIAVRSRTVSRHALLGLVDNLETGIAKLSWAPRGTEWAEYYDDTNYSDSAFQHKREIVLEYIQRAGPRSVWDLGANAGVFSRIASERGIPTIAFDKDPAAIEKLYRDQQDKTDPFLLPLLLDLTNPSPGLGWAHRERMSFIERAPVDMVLALALVHHLAIGNNVPLVEIAAFLSTICRSLVIEFVPKSDSQVQRLLASREDVFPDYTQQAFERDFGGFFTILEASAIRNSERTLYLLENNSKLTAARSQGPQLPSPGQPPA